MDNQVDFWDIKASCGDVGGYETFKFAFLEGLEGDLPLLLRDVSVEDLGFLLEVGLEKNFVGFLFSLAEDNGSTVSSSVKIDDIRDDGISVVVGTI